MGQLKKIVITGPESTGKTTLAARLAEHFGTVWVPEFAREYLLKNGPGYSFRDLNLIARGQLALEETKEREAQHLLFCDTDLLVVKIWSEHVFGKVDPWITKMVNERQYDFYLLQNIDLEWEPDPLREHPHQRQFLLERYIEELKLLGANYKLISGKGNKRFGAAVKAVLKLDS